MKIAIDFLGTDIGSGTKTYNINFCKNVQKAHIKDELYIFLTESYFKELKKIRKNSKIKFIVKSNIYSNVYLRLFWMQFILPFILKSKDIKKLFSPMNICPIINIFKIKIILGLHTNLPWVYFNLMPGSIFRNYITKKIMELSIYRSDLLIVPSNFAKDEIVKALKLKKKKIKVIYHGLIKKKHQTKKHKVLSKIINDKEKFILSVQSIVKYHNIINILKAYKILREKINLNYRFVIITQILDKNYYREINKFITNNFNNKEVIIIKNLNYNEILNFYKYSHLYIFSSYSEVFGFTSLEAMHQKCPVLLSNRSSLPEINGSSSIYFNPDNIDEIRDKIKRLIEDKILRRKLIARGVKHVKKFSWEKSVKETFQQLKSIN